MNPYEPPTNQDSQNYEKSILRKVLLFSLVIFVMIVPMSLIASVFLIYSYITEKFTDVKLQDAILMTLLNIGVIVLNAWWCRIWGIGKRRNTD